MANVNLALLGGLRLQTDSGEPVPLSTKKAWALLAYLALHKGQAQTRPKLAALLWGEHSEVQARDSLRQALSILRKALSHIDPGALIAREDTISFEPTALTTDAIVFGNLVAQPGAENIERAIALYGGEFLEGFQVTAPEFESWATAERERFREMAVEAMTRQLDHHLSTGAVESGIRIGARLLTADPLQEGVHRTLMELYCRQGRHGAALRQYRTCANLLAKELGVEPDGKTKALRREILREWNQPQGKTSDDDAATQSLCDIEIELPVTPRSLERRQVTVLVCELVGVSELAARLDPEELQALIAAYQGCCKPIISQISGTVGKCSGPEILAYFGYPQAHEHAIEHAIRAGLTLVGAVSRLDCGSAGPLQLRVGIATGPVVVGGFLGNGVDQQGIIGEAAELAGRLETFAAPGTVVMTASTRRLIGNLFECEELDSLALDGFPNAIPAFRVLGPSSVDSRFEALRAATTPLTGRDEELELLLRRWRQAAKGQGRVVLLSGEPGIGKSRLTMALAEGLQAERHIRLRFFCSPHHQDSALYPIISQLQRAAGFQRDDAGERRLDKLEALLAQSVDDLSEAAPLIADLLSVPTGDRYLPLNYTPQKRKEKTFRALLALLEGLAARQAVLLVFEDVHWIDPTSLELLDLIIDRVPALAVLLIITFRPEFVPPWIGRPHATLLALNRLPPRERAEMIVGVTGGKALPKDITDKIIDRTDGVPLFIEELTKAVIESGILVEAGDRYAVTGPTAQLTIPTTLQASLFARLDRLAATREVAQIGAALGRQFSHELISAVAPMPQRQLDEALAQLVSAELIFRRGTPPSAEYTFKHALVRDAAYSTLLRSRRQQLHAGIAAILESQFPEIVDVQPQVMAQHCAEAGLHEKAVRYWLKAGKQAIARSVMQEAVAQLQKGLDSLANLPATPWRAQQELELQMALARALMAARGYSAPSVGETIVRATALAEQLARPDSLAALLHFEWVFHLCRAEHKLALSLAEQMEKRGLLQGRFAQGYSHFLLGEIVSARTIFEQCHVWRQPTHRAFHVAIGAEDPYAVSLGLGAVALTYLGYIDQARARMDEALTEARQLAHPHTLAFVLTLACSARWVGGSPHEVQRYAEEVRALSTEHAFPHWLAYASVYSGWALSALGQVQDGLDLLAKGRSARAIGVINLPLALCFLAGAHAKVGQFDKGLNHLAEAAQIVETTNERYCEAELHRLRGELLSAVGDEAGAEHNYHEALAVARRQSAKTFELRAAMSLARLWRGQGKRDEARDLLAPIYNWFTEGFDTPLLSEARAVLAEIAALSLGGSPAPPPASIAPEPTAPTRHSH